MIFTSCKIISSSVFFPSFFLIFFNVWKEMGYSLFEMQRNKLKILLKTCFNCW